jgi:hypothetical protein
MALPSIAALITNRALCCECIAVKTGMEPQAAEQAVKALGYVTTVHNYMNGTCLECRKSALVYAIDRPPS